MRRTGPPDITIESFIGQDLRNQIADLKKQIDQNNPREFNVTSPEVISLVSERADRKGVYPTFQFAIPSRTFGLRCYVVKKSVWDQSSATKKDWRSSDWLDEITDDDRDNGTFQGEFNGKPLDFDTDYYIVFLKAFDVVNAAFATNPHVKEDAKPGNGSLGSGSHLFEWHTKKVFVANPSTPTGSDIITNEPYIKDNDASNAKVEFRLWASNDHLTFMEDIDILDGAIWLLPFVRDGSGNYVITADTKGQRYDTEAEFETAIELDVPTTKHRAIKVITTLPLGHKFRWFRSMLVNPAGKGKSPISYTNPPTNTIPDGVDFWAGGKLAEADSDIPEPVVALVHQIDSRHSEFKVNFTQASTPVLLKNLWVEISYDGGTTWEVVYHEKIRGNGNFDTVGAHSTNNFPVKHKKNVLAETWKLRATLVGLGAVGAALTQPTKTTTSGNYLNFTPAFPYISDGPIDTAAPGAVTNLTLEWSGKKGYVVRFDKPTTNVNTLKGYWIVFYNDSGSTHYMVAETGATSSPDTEAQAQIFVNAEVYKTHTRAVNLGSDFTGAPTPGVRVKVTPVNVVQGADTLGTPTTSSIVNVGDDFVNSQDSVNRITAGAVALPGKQVLPNADFLLDNGTANHLLKWFEYDGFTPIDTHTTDITTTTTNVKWDQVSHSMKFINPTLVAVNLKKGRILPGEKYSLSLSAKSSGTPTGIVLRIYVLRQSDAANNIDNIDNPGLVYCEVPLTGLNTTWAEFGVRMKIKDTPSLDDGAGSYLNQWFAMSLVGTLGGATVFVDRIMFNRGSQPAAFSIREDEEGLISILPTAIAPQTDAPNIIGSRGGWYDGIGEGGVLDRQPF